MTISVCAYFKNYNVQFHFQDGVTTVHPTIGHTEIAAAAAEEEVS